jgi:hypothetical protein
VVEIALEGIRAINRIIVMEHDKRHGHDPRSHDVEHRTRLRSMRGT